MQGARGWGEQGAIGGGWEGVGEDLQWEKRILSLRIALVAMSVPQINVNGSDDPMYRYKMPKVARATEGRGNGIKTNVLNLEDIASALSRDPGHLTRVRGGRDEGGTRRASSECGSAARRGR